MLIFETASNNKDIITKSNITKNDDVTLVEKNKIFGDSDIIQLAIVITPVLITSITTLIVTFVNSKKEFTIKIDGNEISMKGYSKKEIKEILSKYIDN